MRRAVARGPALRTARSQAARSDPGRSRTRSRVGADTLQHRDLVGLYDGPGGIRTRDLGIKSPLLYQLSYRPEYAVCMAKGYAEGSAVEERLAALERGDDLGAALDSGRAAVFG